MHPVTPEKNVFWKNFGKTSIVSIQFSVRQKFSCHKKSINFAHNINRIAYVARQNTDI